MADSETKTILFGVTMSEPCRNAFKHLLENFASPGDKVYLVHVVAPLTLNPRQAQEPVQRRMHALRAVGAHLLEGLKTRAVEHGLVDTEAVILQSADIPYCLTRFARDRNVSVILIGSGRDSNPRSAAQGVGMRLLMTSPIPVIAVPFNG